MMAQTLRVTGAHVLVVDDDDDILRLLTMRLRARGFRVTAVGSAEQALAQIAVDPPRVVVSDVRLPGQDGMALFEEVRRTRPTLPVILLTAHGNIPDAVDATSRGVFGYLTKPFEGEALQTIIRSALDDMRTRRELNANLSDHAQALACIGEGTFVIRTLDEAHKLASFVALLGPQPETLAMGLSELLVNGVEHGNLGIDFAEKSRLREADRWEEEVARRLALDENRGKSVRLRVRGDDSRWTFEIHDDGPGFDWRRFLDFDPERAFAPNGRGIALSRQLSFASLTYLPPGNQVVVTVAKPERHAS